MRSRRAAHEYPPEALLEKTGVDEVPKQDPAHLPVETCHLRGIGGGESYAGCLCEQMPDACERLVETPSAEWLCHCAVLPPALAIGIQ